MKRKLSDSILPTPKRVKTQSLGLHTGRSRTVPLRAKVAQRPRSLPLRYELKPIPEDRSRIHPLRVVRAKEWEEDAVRKTLELRLMRREDEIAHSLREEEVIKRLRKAMEFKAKPMPKFVPICITRSTKKLTEPHSPPFAARRPHQHDH